MTRSPLIDGWTVRGKTSIFADLQGQGATGEPVTLPHDALIGQGRLREGGSAANAHFPDGAFEYRRTLEVPEEWRDRSVVMEFEGVYRDAVVFVNGAFVAQRPNGYARFFVPLTGYLRHGAQNEIRVDARTHDDSRWYAGAGLHREVHLWVNDLVHLDPESGVTITTPEVNEDEATVAVALRLENEGRLTRTVDVTTTVLDPDGREVARASSPVTLLPSSTGTVRQRLLISEPRRWSTDRPDLHRTEVTVTVGDDVLDRRVEHFGIRRLRLDARRGLRINGDVVKLRGACVHSDNGILGAAAFRAAEERRVVRLKDAGFNALRSSHNPMSTAMIEACDRHGMLVMDETFDMWTEAKSPFDYSLALPEWWRRDVRSMVAKDINHPSVIMYSIGNEIPETGDPHGAVLGREMAEAIREADPTRFVTNGINGFVSALSDVVAAMDASRTSAAPADGEDAPEDGGVNALMGNPGDFMNRVSASEMVTDRTAESFSVLDVAGINYGDARYEEDHVRFPDRVVVGSETFPGRIDHNWKLVQENPHVIGDFTWTGWDYLGEVGIGRIQYHDEPRQFAAPYPWLTAWSGDLDICGTRRPVSFYREIVFGLRTTPYIAVHRPQLHGRAHTLGQWSWPDALSSWTWDVPEGSPVHIDVYSPADEIELLLDGVRIGRVAVGTDRAYVAEFETVYRPGELTAVALVDGAETERTTLVTVGPAARLTARFDDTTTEHDVLFVDIAVVDEQGNLVHEVDRTVVAEVDGPAVLQAFGSARPANPEGFDGDVHTTFDGRLLAAVRPTGSGTIALTFRSDGFGSTRVEIAIDADGSTVARSVAASMV